MESETSAVARKLNHIIQLQQGGQLSHHKAKPNCLNESSREEPGVIKNLVLVGLMGLAICFTQALVWMLGSIKKMHVG